MADLEIVQTGDGARESVLSASCLVLYLCFRAHHSFGCGRSVSAGSPAGTDLIIPHGAFINDWLCLLSFQYVAHQYNFCQFPGLDVI